MVMEDRLLKIREFLRSVGVNPDALQFLAKDMSPRQYFRLEGQGTVLMDAPPPHDITPFVNVANYLSFMGLRAPKVHHVDYENGFAVLEDFGNQTFTTLFDDATHRPEDLYKLALDVLLELHAKAIEKPDFLSIYDEPTFFKEANIFIEWYFPYATGRHCPEELKLTYIKAWEAIYKAMPITPYTVALRDYHVDNLMLIAGEGVQKCGLLDFQDAIWAPRVFDVVSLIEDARRNMPKHIKEALWSRYVQGMSSQEIKDNDAIYHIIGACRHLRVIGVFTRYALREKNHSKLCHLPRLWGYVAGNLAHPALEPLKEWFKQMEAIAPECQGKLMKNTT
jgi:aminoglycoside/choline kinase family phosphotransferase